MMVNEKLNLSYLTKLKKEYMKLKETDKITVSELQEAVDEMMEVDEQSKTHLFEILSEQTNLRDILMTSTTVNEETTAVSHRAEPHAQDKNTAAIDRAAADTTTRSWSANESPYLA
jgi:TRAP-type mannitol/chloroaromatic compound transport system substrate-binding protein